MTRFTPLRLPDSIGVRDLLPVGMLTGVGFTVALLIAELSFEHGSDDHASAAKAAILNLTKGLSKTYAKQGVLVNSVSPAYIETPMTDAMMEKRARKNGTSFEEAMQSFLKEERPTLELARRGRPEEVAAAIAFLCSDLASFVNGANYRVDGGSVATVST